MFQRGDYMIGNAVLYRYFSRVGAARCFCALFAQKPETARAGHHVALNGEAVKSNTVSEGNLSLIIFLLTSRRIYTIIKER